MRVEKDFSEQWKDVAVAIGKDTHVIGVLKDDHDNIDNNVNSNVDNYNNDINADDNYDNDNNNHTNYNDQILD